MEREALESSIICPNLDIRALKNGFHGLERITLKNEIIKTPFHRQRQDFPGSQSFRLKGREHETKSNDTGSHKRTLIIMNNDAYTPRPAIFTLWAIYIDFQRAK